MERRTTLSSSASAYFALGGGGFVALAKNLPPLDVPWRNSENLCHFVVIGVFRRGCIMMGMSVIRSSPLASIHGGGCRNVECRAKGALLRVRLCTTQMAVKVSSSFSPRPLSKTNHGFYRLIHEQLSESITCLSMLVERRSFW